MKIRMIALLAITAKFIVPSDNGHIEPNVYFPARSRTGKLIPGNKNVENSTRLRAIAIYNQLIAADQLDARNDIQEIQLFVSQKTLELVAVLYVSAKGREHNSFVIL